MELTEAVVLVDKQGKSIDRMKDTSWYDLFIFHPRTKFIQGIPDWIVAERPLQNIELPDINIQCPCKVLLFEKEDDPLLAVPLFVKEIEKFEKEIRIPMKSDKFQLVISNKEESYLVRG